MLFKRFWICTFCIISICLPLYLFAQAQNPIVLITEISPEKLGEEDEWFEFILQSNTPIDISDWSVSNGTSTKTFLEKKELLIGSGISADENGRLIFESPNTEYLYWSTSPIALPNNGGTIQILDKNNIVLDEVTYPETKKGTLNGELYAEVWNRTKEAHPEQPVFPLLYRQNDQNLRHSRGAENFEQPTFPKEVEILISESSPDNTNTDFVEIYIKSSQKSPINLKYMEIKQKGSPRTLMYFENDFWVNLGEFLLVNFNGAETNALVQNQNPYQISTTASGLSAGSETIEVLLYSGTSWEQSEDFMCWKSGDISQAVRDEVDKKIEEGVWNGDCIDIENLVKNESIARTEPQSDTDTKNDFFRHFHGSGGTQNFTENHTPIAKFIIQGGAKIFHTSLNFTGLDGTDQTSIDPDGTEDLKSFQWRINGKTCGNYETDGWEWRQTRTGEKTCEEESSRSNPDRIYFDFEKYTAFEVSLTVEDFSGAKNTFSQSITRDPFNLSGGASSSFTPTLKKWVEKEFQKTTSHKKGSSPLQEKNNTTPDNFFSDFIAVADINTMKSIFIPEQKIPSPEIKIFQKEKFSPEEKEMVAKNIGLIFCDSFPGFAIQQESKSDTKDLLETQPLVYLQ